MTDDTVTGWRTRLIRLRAWAIAHPDLCLMLAAVVAAFVLGAVLF